MRHHFDNGLLLVIFLCAMTSPELSSGKNIIADTADILRLIVDVSSRLEKTWTTLAYLPLGNNPSVIEANQRNILERMEEMSSEIRHVEEMQSEYFDKTIETLRREFYADSLLAHKMTYVGDVIKSIMQRYSDMTDYQKYKDNVSPYTLRNFAEWTVKPGPSSIEYLLEMLHSYMFGEAEHSSSEDSSTSLFAKLVANYETNEEQYCTQLRSPQQFAFYLYTKSALIEIKGYILLEFSWMLLREYGVGNFSQELSLTREKYQQRALVSQQLLRKILSHTGRIYWRCDPKEHVSGQTYDMITRLMQGYVENEINLNADGSCFKTCDEYQNVHVNSCNQEDQLCHKQSKCAGQVSSCRFIESDMNVCQSSAANSSRRYETIQYDSGRVLGADAGAPKRTCLQDLDRIESWRSYWFWRCEYCFCLCDEKGPLSDRYFSLRDTLSDFQQNMIVTGARFIKDQRVFHLQLQQGQLLPGGLINQSSVGWIPLESFNVTHVDIRHGYDYHELTVDSRSIDLDELTAANDSLVVTGARFRVINQHLNLEVRFSEFNFGTGRLLQPEVNSFWLSNNAVEPRQKLFLTDPDKSEDSKLMSSPLSKHNQFMDFTSSSVDKDAAQQTVPYIDVQDVVTDPAMPLSGLGIYHKGIKGFGGFFAPKIMPINLLLKFMQPAN